SHSTSDRITFPYRRFSCSSVPPHPLYGLRSGARIVSPSRGSYVPESRQSLPNLHHSSRDNWLLNGVGHENENLECSPVAALLPRHDGYQTPFSHCDWETRMESRYDGLWRVAGSAHRHVLSMVIPVVHHFWSCGV